MVDPTEFSLFIVDDHALFRSGLRMILQSRFSGARVEEVASVEALLAVHPPRPPDLVLLDIRLQGLNGLESIALIQRRWPAVPIVMLSSDADRHTIREAHARGAAAFVSKAEDSDEILRVIEGILQGQDPQAAPAVPADGAGLRLTARQGEVLLYLAQGLSNKLIARKLALSENTVRGHVQSIMALFGSTSRAQAVYRARQAGLLN